MVEVGQRDHDELTEGPISIRERKVAEELLGDALAVPSKQEPLSPFQHGDEGAVVPLAQGAPNFLEFCKAFRNELQCHEARPLVSIVRLHIGQGHRRQVVRVENIPALPQRSDMTGGDSRRAETLLPADVGTPRPHGAGIIALPDKKVVRAGDQVELQQRGRFQVGRISGHRDVVEMNPAAHDARDPSKLPAVHPHVLRALGDRGEFG